MSGENEEQEPSDSWLTSFSPEDGRSIRNSTIGRVLGAFIVLGIIAVGTFLFVGRSEDSTEAGGGVINVNGDIDNSCVFVGENNSCIVEAAENLTPSQQSWLNQPDFEAPASWPIVERWVDVASGIFGDLETIVLEPDDQLESGRATRTPEGFTLELSDTKTVTGFIDFNLGWPGPIEPPYYARIDVVQRGGPVESRACGLLFNAKYGVDYTDPANRWFIAKAAGGDAQVTQWTDLDENGNINHRIFENYENVLAPEEPATIEVLVEESRWTVAINGTVVGSRETALGPNHIFPAGQQETTLRRGNVLCEFSDWELRQP